MASTKTRTSLASAVTLTAGAGNTTSSAVDLSAGYGAIVDIKFTNGATGPTVSAQSQVQIAADWNGGSPTLWTNFGSPLIASNANSAVSYFSVEIPIGAAAVRIVSGSNTAQNVTLDADVSVVTAL